MAERKLLEREYRGILNVNLNGWIPVCRDRSYDEKLGEFASLVTGTYDHPCVIFLQEALSGKHVEELQQKLKKYYYLLLPAGFDWRAHPHSITCATLLRRDAFWNVRKLPIREGLLANRVLYLEADTALGPSEGALCNQQRLSAT